MKYYETNPQKAICLDVETTGVDPDTAEILQLSIIDYNGNVLFNEYIKPDKAKIWPGAEAVHHISPLKVLDKPHLSFYHEKLKKIFDDAELIIAYNGDHYDIPIIARYGFPELKNKQSFDVMLEFAPIYGAWDDYHGSYTWQKLNVCADYYGYRGDDNFHDSLEDVRATLFCYKKMTAEQEKSDVTNEDSFYQYEEDSIDEADEYDETMSGSSYDFEELADRVYQVEEELAEKYCEISASFMDRGTALNAISKPKISVFIYGLILSCEKLRERNMFNQASREAILKAFDSCPQAIDIDLTKYLEHDMADEWKYNSIINFGSLKVFADFFDKVENIIDKFYNK